MPRAVQIATAAILLSASLISLPGSLPFDYHRAQNQFYLSNWHFDDLGSSHVQNPRFAENSGPKTARGVVHINARSTRAPAQEYAANFDAGRARDRRHASHHASTELDWPTAIRRVMFAYRSATLYS